MSPPKSVVRVGEALRPGYHGLAKFGILGTIRATYEENIYNISLVMYQCLTGIGVAPLAQMWRPKFGHSFPRAFFHTPTP
jgi:hypothetical protein